MKAAAIAARTPQEAALDQFDPQEVANTLWAFGMLGGSIRRGARAVRARCMRGAGTGVLP